FSGASKPPSSTGWPVAVSYRPAFRARWRAVAWRAKTLPKLCREYWPPSSLNAVIGGAQRSRSARLSIVCPTLMADSPDSLDRLKILVSAVVDCAFSSGGDPARVVEVTSAPAPCGLRLHAAGGFALRV